MTPQAQRRADLRARQAQRQEALDRQIALDRVRQLCSVPPTTEREQIIDRLAIDVLKASPAGIEESELPPSALSRLVEQGKVAVFRGRVVERGAHG